MTMLPAGVKVHLAFGYTDMCKGMDALALLVQEVLHQDPFSGHLFVFRGRKANLIKDAYWDGTGLCLFTKRFEHGDFLWPSNIEPGPFEFGYCESFNARFGDELLNDEIFHTFKEVQAVIEQWRRH